MSSCVYCGKNTLDSDFSREHVVPQFLGSFSPVNPVIQKRDRLVCETCNSVTFSALENIYKEDSEDGLLAQRLNLNNSGSIRIRGERLKIETVSGFGDEFFNQIFPFLKPQDNRIVVDLKPQIKIRNYRDGYQVFLIDELEKIKERDGRKFEQVKKRMLKVKPADFSIFTFGEKNDEQDLTDAIALLKSFGIDYKERKRHFAPTSNLEGQQWEENLQCILDTDITRIIAKIAFNYLAYCAIHGNQTKTLFLKEFEQVRNFIAGKSTLGAKDIIISIDKDVILGEEKGSNTKHIVHLLTFECIDSKIVAKLSFFGRHVYEVFIGATPDEYKSESFGCGHAFDPFIGTIIPLSQNPADALSETELRNSFGLFKRVRPGQ